jgi:hypothetical protein
MKDIKKIYQDNKKLVNNFIFTTIGRLNISTFDDKVAKVIHDDISCAKLIYFVDDEYKLASSYYLKHQTDNKKMGIDKKYFFQKTTFNDLGEYISNLYISSSTGNMNTTYVKKIDDGYLVIDFDIISVLEKLRLIRNSKIAKNINLFVYGFMGFSLLIFALALGFYSIIIFLNTLLHLDMFNLEVIFKSIIALTLGLAIFDLAKTILEHEIFFRNIIRDEHDSNEILSKFLISIIIALSIESLMVVFKIALSDYTGMIHAFYLILGVSLLIYTLGKYNSFTSKNR